jgi:LmbE family N-acetylglucosaminyl deacetylase
MKVLVIGAHADDPEVSMGGTITDLVSNGHDVSLLVCIVPQEDRAGNIISGAKTERQKFQTAAADKLRCQVNMLDMNPYNFEFGRHLVKQIDAAIVKYKPNVIFTHWHHDSHQDHQAVSLATFAAARKNNVSVLMYEQLTLGGITPNSFNSHVYVDISNVLDTKISSVKSYKFLSDNDIDAIISLARFRGNQIGVKYAECFEVCKIIADVTKDGLSIFGNWNTIKC